MCVWGGGVGKITCGFQGGGLVYLHFVYRGVGQNLVNESRYQPFFLSIDTESIKFRSSSQVWWVAKF